MIFKEALNNAAKYSAGNEVRVTLTLVNNTLTLLVTDNGKGFEEATIKAGNGLRNMESRAREMHARLQRKSTPEQGTEVLVEIPLT